MEEFKVKGIVINSIDYKEKDRLITIFSLELGKITATLKGVKNANAKLKFAAQKFCFAEFVLVKTADYFTVASAELIESFYELTSDYTKYLVAEIMLEMVSIIMQPQQINEQLFIHTAKMLGNLCYDEEINENIVLIKYFLLVFSFTGYSFNYQVCSECNTKFVGDVFFDFTSSNFACKNCSSINSIQVTNGDIGVLKIIDLSKLDMLKTIKFKNYNYNNLILLLGKNFSTHFGKTLKVLSNYLL